MKKLLAIILLFPFFLSNAIAQDKENKELDEQKYIQEAIEFFVNAPSFKDLEKIEDKDLRYCEETFLINYMRRDFTQEENNKCRELFAKRIESEIIFKKEALKKRWIY